MIGRLQKSIEQYRQIVGHAQQLDQLLAKGDAEPIRNYAVQLEILQAKAGEHDRELLEEVAQDAARWQVHPLFLERMQLLEQIMEMNDLLLPKIRGMMSITAAELAQVKEGRVAVSGYHQEPARASKSIRGIG